MLLLLLLLLSWLFLSLLLLLLLHALWGLLVVELLQYLTIPVDPKLPNMVTYHPNIGEEPNPYILHISNTNPHRTMSKVVQYQSVYQKPLDMGTHMYIDYILNTNLMRWLLPIHKILFCSTCFEPQVLIFGRIQVYTCSIWYCHSVWEFLVACRCRAWVSCVRTGDQERS